MDSSSSFQNKVVLITGAARGIGKATAIEFAKKNAHVIAVSRTKDDLLELQKQYPNNIEVWAFDITGDEFYAKMESLDRLDICINNAGVNQPKFIEDVDDATLDLMLDLNVRATFRTSKFAVKLMKKNNQGVIINVTSQMGHVGGPIRSVYNMNKWGLEGLTKGMSIDLAKYNIRVNTVCPTFVITPMTKKFLKNKKFKKETLNNIPLGRFAELSEIASSVVFLASDAASMITGTSLLVDGGWTAK